MKDGDFPGMFSLIAPAVKVRQTEDLPWGGNYDCLDEAKNEVARIDKTLQCDRSVQVCGHFAEYRTYTRDH